MCLRGETLLLVSVDDEAFVYLFSVCAFVGGEERERRVKNRRGTCEENGDDQKFSSGRAGRQEVYDVGEMRSGPTRRTKRDTYRL